MKDGRHVIENGERYWQSISSSAWNDTTRWSHEVIYWREKFANSEDTDLRRSHSGFLYIDVNLIPFPVLLAPPLLRGLPLLRLPGPNAPLRAIHPPCRMFPTRNPLFLMPFGSASESDMGPGLHFLPLSPELVIPHCYLSRTRLPFQRAWREFGPLFLSESRKQTRIWAVGRIDSLWLASPVPHLASLYDALGAEIRIFRFLSMITSPFMISKSIVEPFQ
jgi:hypothetical protein